MRAWIPILMIAAAAVALAQAPNTLTPEEKQEGFVLLFNGHDLTGWDGDPRLWSVRDGVILGSTEGVPIKPNSFLIYKDQPKDFVLRLDIKLRNHNSGIQFRSERRDNWVVAGLQADASEAGDELSAWGNLYEERGRGRNLMATTDEGWQKAKNIVKHGDWNHYEIIAQGPRVILRLNGTETINQEVDVTSAGVIAVQIHQGDPMQVELRNIRLKVLD